MTAVSKHENQEFHFFKLDASSIKDTDRFLKEVKKLLYSKGGVNYIFQSQGILNTKQEDTEEGLDRAFVINCFSKWMITHKLIPLLKESCVYICNPRTQGELDFTDMEVKKHRTMFAPGERDGIYIDALALEFQKQYPSLRFYHLTPGIVDTNIAKNSGMGVIISGFVKLFAPLVRSPLVYADNPIYAAINLKEGGLRFNEKGKGFNNYPFILNEDNRAKLWEWNINLVSKFFSDFTKNDDTIHESHGDVPEKPEA